MTSYLRNCANFQKIEWVGSVEMFLLALAFLARSEDLKFCFYKSNAGDCPSSGYTRIAVGSEDFKKFVDTVYEDVQSVELMLACNMEASEVLAFRHFNGENVKATVRAADQKGRVNAYLDFQDKKLASLGLSKISVRGLSGALNADELSLLETELPHVDEFVAAGLVIDPFSLRAMSRVSVKSMNVVVGASWSGDMEVNVTSPNADVELSGIEKNLTIEMRGSSLWLTLAGSSGVFKLNWPGTTSANPMKITHDKSGVDLVLKSVIYGMGVHKPCYFNVVATNGAIVSIPQAMWPNADFMTDIAATISCDGAHLQLGNAVTPISISLRNGNLNLATPNVTVTGTVTFGKGVNVVAETLNIVKFGNLVLDSDAESVRFDASEVIVQKALTVKAAKFEFQGRAMYQVNDWGLSIFDVTFPNLDVSRPFKATYSLEAASHVKVSESVKGSDVIVNMKWIGDKPTAEAIAEKQGQEWKLIELPTSVKYSVLFDAEEARGLAAGAHVFSQVENSSTTCTVKLDYTLDQVANKFCWDSSALGCTDGYFDLFANNYTLDQWTTFVRPDVRFLEFELVSGYKGQYQFDMEQFSQNKLTLSVIMREKCSSPSTPMVILRTTLLAGQVENFRAEGGTVVFDKSGVEVVATGNWELRNATMGRHNVEMVRCQNLTSVTTDEVGIKSGLFNGCHPATLTIETDSYSTVTFHKESLTFSGPEAVEVDIPVSAGPRPHVIFNLNRTDLEFVPGVNETGPFLPVVEFTNIHPSHTLTIGNFSRDFHGLFGYAINGTLIVNSSEGQVPIDIIGNKEVDVQSDGDVDIIYPWCVNTHLTPVSMAAGTELKFEEAYFGTSSNISIPDYVTFHVVNGYQNHYGRIKAPVHKMRLSKNMTMWPYSELPVDNFDFIGNEASFHIMYRLAEMPYMRLDRPADHVDYTPTVTLAYQDGNDDEINYITENSDSLAGYPIPIICGENLACCSWKLVMQSSNPTFSEGGPLELTCQQITSTERCVVLRVKPLVNDGNKGAIIAAIILGCVAAVLIGAFIVLCCRRRRQQAPGLRTEHLLKST